MKQTFLILMFGIFALTANAQHKDGVRTGLYRDLNFNEAQVAALKRITEASRVSSFKVVHDTSLDLQRRRAELIRIDLVKTRSIDSLLTPGQRLAFGRYLRKRTGEALSKKGSGQGLRPKNNVDPH